MDVRCEKCQTEYELDESRLKPGGVTVKCTNCGHMFKIRKRTPTNVGSPAVGTPAFAQAQSAAPERPRAPSASGSMGLSGEEGPTAVERQWVIRLENGEQKTCRELATLQQWIVSNVVTREALISRTGKTWKRLGDIAELAQYFDIADEARTTRPAKPTAPKAAAGTMLGVGGPQGPSAAGGTIVPDDDEVDHATGNFRAHKPSTQPPPPPARTPPMGSNVTTGQTAAPRKQPITQPPTPPPQPSARPATPTPAAASPSLKGPQGPDSRSTGVWAHEPLKAKGVAPSGPFVGKLAAIPDEPAFAGRVRVSPSDESSFETGKVGIVDDDDQLMPRGRGSRAGLIILVMMLLVGAGAAAIVYLFVLKKEEQPQQVATPSDAMEPATPDGSLLVTPVVDAGAEVPPPSPVDIARGELGPNVETRLRASLETLPKDDPAVQAVRANIGAAVAQSLLDRAALVADKREADKLRKESKTIVLDAATAAQRAHKAAPDDAAANVAMAHVLRLQGKSLKDMQRYLDAARAKGSDWTRDIALAEALVYARDGKLDDARKVLEGVDAGANKLETSNDTRARFHLALIAHAQKRTADAKSAVETILAAQPEHLGAKALAAKLETQVSNTDPLPPEDQADKPDPGKPTEKPPGPAVDVGGSYDQLLARANKMAESNCTKALELFAKALEQKPNGVEALTGQGYCHIDSKQFASAFSKFRSALAISPRYEPALWGIAEAYQQQGRREQAIEAYKRYLEVYPGTAKAQKQLDRLGGSAQPPPPGPGSEAGSASAPAPTPPVDTSQPQKEPPREPTPTPVPVPEGGGSGG